MLLKQLTSVFVLVCFYLSISFAQNFKSGLVRLTSPSLSLPSTYTINYDHQTNDLIIAICSFTAQPVTSCFITVKTNRQANFTCTSNIQIIAFLFYQKTPMIYANSFSYYFFAGSKADRQSYAVWKVQKGLTLALNPQLRAVLSGFKAKDAVANKIELNELDDGWSINITRTPNIQIVNFSYILIQNYSPYNLTFVDYIVPHSTNLSLAGLRTNYLNFWGIQSLKSTRSSLTVPYGVVINFDSALATDSNILSINYFSITNNTSIQGLFLIDNTNLNTLNCGSTFYDPSLSRCINQCSGYNISWNTSIFYYRYCLNNVNGSITMNETYIDSNLWQMVQYTQIGCAQSTLMQDLRLACLRCQSGYTMYSDRCVCQYGFYFHQGKCHKCTQADCQLPIVSSISLNNTLEYNRTIAIKISLPLQQKYNITSQTPFEMNVSINSIVYLAQAQYMGSSKSLDIVVKGVQANNKYQILVKANGHDNNQLLLIEVSGASFLWAPSANIILSSPLAAEQAVLQSIAPLLADTDKSIPVIMVFIFFVGDKINTLSLFQTVSLLYLINFIPIGEQYNPLVRAISQIFIFQPKPLISIAGSHPDAWIFIPTINTTQVPYNKLVHLYTKGEMFITFALNCLVSLLIQIGTIVVVLKLGKKCLKQSNNRVSPYIAGAIQGVNLGLSRSRMDKNGKIHWLRDIQVRESASFRYKCYVYLCKLDDKKWIGISSLWNMQVLSLSFLLLHELSIPFTSFYSLLSSLSCYLTLFIILFFPIYLRQYQPLYLLKCLSICYKRRQYQQSQLWLYFYLNSAQPLLYACIVIGSESPSFVLGSIIFLMGAKVLFLRSTAKRIQVLRVLTIGLFFGAALVSCNVDVSYASTMTSIMGFALFSVVGVQMLKLLRSVIILILSCFKTTQAEPQRQQQKLNPPQFNQSNPVLDYFTNKHFDKKFNSEETTQPTTMQKELEKNNYFSIEDSSKDINANTGPQYKSRAFRRRLANAK